MTREQVYREVTGKMAELFDLDASAIREETRFEDLNLTSLDAIDLVVELQRMTGRRVAEAGLRKVRTVGDMVDLVEAHLAEAPAGGPPSS
ncbi:MAG TPA: acyl carrier protein [Anaeromyxobacteraceae bacterium]|nr:acyl carrier protein [Anaeromyxobacteraceae bacterium]